MDPLKLSKRLLRIAQYVPVGKKVADIGSDHALLPSYLVKNMISPFAIAGEVNEGPFLAAQRQISSIRLDEEVSVRKGDGLALIEANEINVITIAGMGGALISNILERGKEKLNTIERLILQPNVGSDLVRIWLDNHNWNIIAENILEEDNKIYEIIVAEPRKDKLDPVYKSADKTKEELYRLGPNLWEEKSEVLLKKWVIELHKVEYILKQLNKSKNKAEKKIKEKRLLEEKKWISEVVLCLQKDKTSFKSLNN